MLVGLLFFLYLFLHLIAATIWLLFIL